MLIPYFSFPILDGLGRRHTGPEIMDVATLPFSTTQKVYKNLSMVNSILGVDGPSLLFVKKFIEDHPNQKSLRILDIGCGQGDKLRKIQALLLKKGVEAQLVGVDLNEDVVKSATKSSGPNCDIQFLAKNVYDFDETVKFDIVLCTNVLHHLSDEDILKLIKWSEHRSEAFFFIDLYRSALTFIGWWTLCHTLLSFFGAIIRTDGFLSIKKSFREADFVNYVHKLSFNTGKTIIKKQGLFFLSMTHYSHCTEVNL